MKKEELEKIKNEYLRLINERDSIAKLRANIEEYENKPDVIEYLKMVEQLEKKKNKNIEDKPNNYFIYDAIGVAPITPTNDIYVFIGAYENGNSSDINRNSRDHLVTIDNPNVDYVIYKNIELRQYSFNGTQMVHISKVKEFEETHNIIYPDNPYRGETFFRKLQEMFYMIAINESEEKAVESIKTFIKIPKKSI